MNHRVFSLRLCLTARRWSIIEHVRLEAKALHTPTDAHRVGKEQLTVASVGDATITREVMEPGWKWSTDVKPVVGTDLCRALHQLFIVSGRLHVVMEDGAELQLRTGDAAAIPPGHDAWVVGDERCEAVDFSRTYAELVDAGEAYQALTAPRSSGKPCSRSQAAQRLRAEARAGRLDPGAVALVLGAVGSRPRRRSGPAGLTAREVEVLVLIATGASAKQVAYFLGIAPKTASAHIERIYMKCAVSSRSDATRFAIAHGLVNPITPTGR